MAFPVAPDHSNENPQTSAIKFQVAAQSPPPHPHTRENGGRGVSPPFAAASFVCERRNFRGFKDMIYVV